MSEPIPIIAIDGTAGSGKGLLSLRLACHTGFNLLDSGALYRIVAFLAKKNHLDEKKPDFAVIEELVQNMAVRFVIEGKNLRTYLDGVLIDGEIRTENMAELASVYATMNPIRELLLPKQRDFAAPPGLIADGRDMGVRVFPQAALKLFLRADHEVATQRRLLQLRSRGVTSDSDSVGQQIRDRDLRDRTRDKSPSLPAPDAEVIDTSAMDSDQVFQFTLDRLRATQII